MHLLNLLVSMCFVKIYLYFHNSHYSSIYVFIHLTHNLWWTCTYDKLFNTNPIQFLESYAFINKGLQKFSNQFFIKLLLDGKQHDNGPPDVK